MPIHSDVEIVYPGFHAEERPWPQRRGETDRPIIEIGLVNNMPDAALLATERQFIGLIRAGAAGRPVRVHLFSLPTIPRSDEGRARMKGYYNSIGELADWPLDALIVTGTEPKAADLRDEPYWDEFAWLVDWARNNTVSTVFSCLAAHAAVLRLDGVKRQPLDAKCSGVFDSHVVADHPLLRGFALPLKVSHSRWNRLDPGEIAQRGYRILTRSVDAGVDIFTRETDASRFVFLQGHPEYDESSLMREYRRDVGRYLAGERDRYPAYPAGYFSKGIETELERLQAMAQADRGTVSLQDLPPLEPREGLANEMSATAARLFRNWFDMVEWLAATSRDASRRQDTTRMINA